MSHRKNISLAFVASTILAFGFFAHAQSATSILNVSISPGEPSAYENVQVNLESFSVDLKKARISWVLNGKSAEGGVGKTAFQFRTGALGTVSRVRVTATTVIGERFNRSFEVRPAEVDLIWETFTYTPPFYEGKALISSKSKVKISVIPHFILENGRRISPDDLIYIWQKGRRVLGSLSGTGRRSIVIDGPRLFEKTRIGVEISSLSGAYNARKEIVLTARDPEIIFYEKHPTEGVRYGIAVEPEMILSQEEITLRAEPYFFSTEDLALGRTNFKWSLNNERVQSISRVNEITLRREEASGLARLTLQIENTAKILQNAVANLLINF